MEDVCSLLLDEDHGRLTQNIMCLNVVIYFSNRCRLRRDLLAVIHPHGRNSFLKFSQDLACDVCSCFLT